MMRALELYARGGLDKFARSHNMSSHSGYQFQTVKPNYWWDPRRHSQKMQSRLDAFLAKHGLVFVPLMLGLLIGVAASSILFLYPSSPLYGLGGWANLHLQPLTDYNNDQLLDVQGEVENLRPRHLYEEVRIRKNMYVGVMTAKKFLKTRATAVNLTWGQYVDKMEFFSQHGTPEEYKLKIVNLDVDDSIYPPQQKAFKMMQYMCDNYIDDYDWFIRSDDDVYMKINKLKELLSTMDRDKQLVIGQPGYGLPAETNKLGLNGNNFCMGGPGVIFSRPALLNLCPHITQCMRDVVSDQEDVEIGRCVTKHLGIQCTRAWDTLKLFYHAYTEDYGSATPYTDNLNNDQHYQSAVTLHHAKQPYIMHNIHYHHLQDQLQYVQEQITKYTEKLKQVELKLNRTSNPATVAVERDMMGALWQRMQQEVNIPWNSFNKQAIDSPVSVTHHLKEQLQETVQEATAYLKSFKDDTIKVEQFESGYWRQIPGAGTQYMLDFSVMSGNPAGTNHLKDVEETRYLVRVNLAQTIQNTHVRLGPYNSPPSSIKIVIPFKIEYFQQFDKFIRNLEESLFSDRQILKFSVSAFAYCDSIDGNNHVGTVRKMIEAYQQKFPQHEFSVNFRTIGSKPYSNIDVYTNTMNENSIGSTDLIIYLKINTMIDMSFIDRCKINSVKGHMIYYAYPPSLSQDITKQGDDTVICGYGVDLKPQKLGGEGNVENDNEQTIYDLFNPNIVILQASDTGLIKSR